MRLSDDTTIVADKPKKFYEKLLKRWMEYSITNSIREQAFKKRKYY